MSIPLGEFVSQSRVVLSVSYNLFYIWVKTGFHVYIVKQNTVGQYLAGLCSLLCSLFTHLFIVKGTGGSQAWRDLAGLVVVCSLKKVEYTTCQKALSPAKLYNAFYLYIVKRKFRKRILFENE